MGRKPQRDVPKRVVSFKIDPSIIDKYDENIKETGLDRSSHLEWWIGMYNYMVQEARKKAKMVKK